MAGRCSSGGADNKMAEQAGIAPRARHGVLHAASLIASGLVVGVLLVTYSISFSAVAFSEVLAAGLPRAIGIGLFSATVMALITSLASSPGTIGGPQDATAAVLAIAIGSAAAALPPGASADQLYATAYVTLATASFLTASAFLCLGYFRLGNLVRYIPYPVMAGFLAATGWLLVKGAFGLMAGTTLTLANLHALLPTDVAAVWIPGTLVGLALLAGSWRIRRPLTLPTIIIGSLVLFYLALAVAGVSIGEARSRGFLLGPFPGSGFVSSIDPALIVRHGSLPPLRAFIEILTIVIISVLGILLNVSGIEAATRKNVDLNRDLVSAGCANLVSGLGGGIVGYPLLSLTILANRLGADTRAVGLTAAAVCAFAFFFGAGVLAFVPKAIVAGVVLFLGMDLLFGGLHREWNRLPALDFLIIVLIFVVAAMVGFLEGIGLGVVTGTILFIVAYSNINVVRQEFPGNQIHSNVDRPATEEAVLNARGAQTAVMVLQGYVFFGTANQIYDHVRDKIAEAQPRLERLLIDFRHVTGLDSSALQGFEKLVHLLQDHAVSLVVTGIPGHLATRLRNLEVEPDAFVAFKDLDSGLEWCEEETLRAHPASDPEHPVTLQDSLAADIFGENQARAFIGYLEEHTFQPGERLLAQGAPSDDIIFIESGRATVMLELANGNNVRLRTMGAGTVVGEIGAYLRVPRTASVVADEICHARRLTGSKLAAMESERPLLVATFHRFMARRLSRKLADSNRMLEAILR